MESQLNRVVDAINTFSFTFAVFMLLYALTRVSADIHSCRLVAALTDIAECMKQTRHVHTATQEDIDAAVRDLMGR